MPEAADIIASQVGRVDAHSRADGEPTHDNSRACQYPAAAHRPGSAGIEVKKFDSPDETRQFQGNGKAEIVNIGGQTVLRGTFEPGWQWSKNIKPLAGTESCESPHFLYCLEGRMAVRMNDGTEEEIGPGDVVKIEPGHEAWVVGNETCRAVDFGAMGTYAQKH